MNHPTTVIMKMHRLLSLSLSFTALLALAPVNAQEAKPGLKLDEEPKKEDTSLDPAGKLPMANKEVAPTPVLEKVNNVEEVVEAIKKLSPDKLSKFMDLKAEATSYLRTVRLQEALQRLQEAQDQVGETVSELENLRGAVYTKLKDYPSARTHFQKALTLEGEKFHPAFNIAELNFVERKFPEAITDFTKLIEENKKLMDKTISRTKGDTALSDQLRADFGGTEKLIRYKILIAHLKLGAADKAGEILATFSSFDDNAPAYYFAKAAAEFVKIDALDKDSPEAKKIAEKGQEWINSAKNIYGTQQNETYLDSIIEMGWLQGIQ